MGHSSVSAATKVEAMVAKGGSVRFTPTAVRAASEKRKSCGREVNYAANFSLKCRTSPYVSESHLVRIGSTATCGDRARIRAKYGELAGAWCGMSRRHAS